MPRNDEDVEAMRVFLFLARVFVLLLLFCFCSALLLPTSPSRQQPQPQPTARHLLAAPALHDAKVRRPPSDARRAQLCPQLVDGGLLLARPTSCVVKELVESMVLVASVVLLCVVGECAAAVGLALRHRSRTAHCTQTL